MTRRLIEDWLPIAALGIESVRERTPMTPFPAPNRLHVWWARRPLVASRAAILASLLPADADKSRFLRIIGVHGDPIAAKKRIEKATREGRRLGADAYGYKRAFTYLPSNEELRWMRGELARISIVTPRLLDPTAGGGAIPLEALRLGIATTGNDLNPVAALIERATVEWPASHGHAVRQKLLDLGRRLSGRVRTELATYFPNEPHPALRPDAYLWARTIRCPHCEGLVPLSPNWRLLPNGSGISLVPNTGSGPGDRVARAVAFRVVAKLSEQSPGTVTGGDATCPFPDCSRVISGDDIKAQAQAGSMGDQLFAVATKHRVVTGRTKAGAEKGSWELRFRAPRREDDILSSVTKRLAEKFPEWEARGILPTEQIGELSNYDRGHRMYGMNRWTDMMSSRQLLVLLCQKRSRAFTRRQHGHRGSVLSKAAAIRSRKLVMDDGTWRCVRWAAARLVMRG